jgi:hypothetical protein
VSGAILEVLLDIRDLLSGSVSEPVSDVPSARRKAQLGCGHLWIDDRDGLDEGDNACDWCDLVWKLLRDNPTLSKCLREMEGRPTVWHPGERDVEQPPDLMEEVAKAGRRVREPGYGRCRTCTWYAKNRRCHHPEHSECGGCGEILTAEADRVLSDACGPDFGCIHYDPVEKRETVTEPKPPDVAEIGSSVADCVTP